VYGGGTCGGATIFVDPDTGELHNPATKSNTVSPTTWSMSSLSILAAMSATRTSTLSMTALATTTATPTIDDYPHSAVTSGLSTAECAGIAVGIAVAVTAIGILAWLFVRERRKRKVLQPKSSQLKTLPETKSETASARKAQPQELEDKARSEVP
jgi:beta-lactamase regulating signal transducer with metallopeptidase domain